MASLELRSERYRIVFRFGGTKFQAPLKTTDPKEAQGIQVWNSGEACPGSANP